MRRLAVVTGSTLGIGKAIATQFLVAGFDVVINGRDPVVLSKVREALLHETGSEAKFCSL